eukprot:gene1852-2185_t
MNPGIYFHRVPPIYLYGYTVRNVPCEAFTAAQLAETAARIKADGKGASQYAGQYGLWIVPSLPGPPVETSEDDQSCGLIMAVQNKVFQSTNSFPCKLTPVPAEELGKGCCYDPAKKFRRSMLSFYSRIPVSQ